MADVDGSGMITNARVRPMRFVTIERGPLAKIDGIIVHQTDSFEEKSVFAKYRNPKVAGAHFLIGKDGTIWQTASLLRRTNHVGNLKPRCLARMACAPAELKTLKEAVSEPRPKVSNRIEMSKSVPQRYPANSDSIGIELVGKASLPAHKPIPPGLTDQERKIFRDEHSVYEAVTPAQQASLQWLIDFLRQNLQVPAAEVHRHPDVSWKNRTEASTAQWK